jgi:hypothetical protein
MGHKKFAGKGGRRAIRKSKRSMNGYQQFIKSLETQFGAFRFSPAGRWASKKQVTCIYDSKVPPRMPNPQGPINGAVYSTTQYVSGDMMTLPTGSAVVGALLRQSTNADVFASFAFALADVGNVASLGAVYDQYRIDRIHFRLRSRNPGLFMMNQASPNYSATPMLVVLDRDDNTAPTTLSELKQYDNCQVISAQDSIDIVFEPSITRSVFAGGVFSGYEVVTDPDVWLDVANTGIPHYGLKIGIPALVTATTSKMDWDVEAWYTLSFLGER